MAQVVVSITETVDGGGGGTQASPWNVGDDLFVGNTGSGTLTIQNGGLVSNNFAIIGVVSGSMGAVTVTGAGSTWTNANNLTVGFSGSGTLTIADGGAVSNNSGVVGKAQGGTGEVTVTGAGSSWANSGSLYVGDAGSGIVSVLNGATMSSNDAYIGDSALGNGTVTVTGTGSAWNANGTLRVGNERTGLLTVSDGGTVTATDEMLVGDLAGSNGTVSVTNASLTADNILLGDAGTGGMTISSGGTATGEDIILGNASTAIGNLTVKGAGSTLNANVEINVGLAGKGTMIVSDGGTVNAASDSTIANWAGSTGSLTIDGAGSTWNNAGTFYVNQNGTAALTISNGGVLNSSNGYVGYDSSGSGTVLIDGSGSEWASTGSLIVGEDGTGAVTLTNSGTLSVNSGAGTLTLGNTADGKGTLNIGAASTDSAAAAGMLNVSTVSFGAGTGVLVFNHTESSYGFSADLTGAGNISHNAGVTNYTGDGSAFTGTTFIYGGTLNVNSTLAGNLGIAGGTLGGSGIVNNLAVGTGGNLAPGNSIGTMNVSTIAFNTGSTYTVELNNGGFAAGTNNDVVIAAGSAAIGGGTIHVIPENGTDDGLTYTLGTYTILTAANVTGTFDSVTDGYVFLDFTASYDATNVYLTSQQGAYFSDVARTPNQKAIAPRLEALGSGNAVYDALVGIVGSDDDARAAMDSLTGEAHVSAKTALLEDSRFPREAAAGRLRNAFGGAQTEDRMPGRFGLWGQGFGSWSRWGSDSNAATMTRAIGGLLVGADAAISDNARFGLLAGYSRTGFGVADRMSSGKAVSYTLGAYGGGTWGAFSLSGGLAHSWHSVSTSRTVAFSSFTDSLTAFHSARTLQVWSEASYDFETDAARFEPFANLAYVNLHTNGFTETGGAAALTAASSVTHATFTTLGVRTKTNVELAGKNAASHGMVAWRHAFSATPSTQMTFASGGNTFGIAGVPLAQDSLLFNVGLGMKLTENATLGFSYTGQFGTRVRDHAAKASLNLRF